MKYRGFDLNLLVALNALLSTASVSRAAERAFVTQPAMSAALRRLRAYFNDPLLTPGKRGMVLTPVAKSLLPEVAELLRRVDSTVLTNQKFDAAESRRHFRILVADTVLLGILDERIREAMQEAPNTAFEFVSPKMRVAEAIENGDVDLMIVPEGVLAAGHPSARLFEESHSVIACAMNGAIGPELTLDQFGAAGHVEVSMGGHRNFLPDELFADSGVVRRIEVVVDDFLQVPFHIRGTRRLATMPSRTAEFFSRLIPLRLFEPPMPIPPVRISMQWMQALDTDPAIVWLRSMIAAGS